MQKLKLHLLVGALFFSTASSSYADGPKLWIENSGGFLSFDHLTNGKTRVRRGFFGGFDLKELIKDNPNALALTEKQTQFNTYAHLSYWLGALPSSFFLSYGIGANNSTMIIISAVTFVGTGLLTGHFISQSNHYMYEAINIYNGVKQSNQSPELSSTSSAYQQNYVSYANAVELSFSF